ncbi:MAG: hypothetical protein M3Y86_08535 [Verrucomicrobiota bacterium]|nr:hypothetical protein [Verrucomicrobiota bacterium]
MKLPCSFVLLLFAGTAVIATADPVPNSEPQLAAAIKDVQAQQVQIADNQAKIEEKLASIAEAVRLARIYASRGGR